MSTKLIKPTSSEVEVVTESQVTAAELSGIAQAITRSREIIQKHESACHETTLEHYLNVGQQLARAQEIFTLSQPEQLAVARNSKALVSTVDTREETTLAPSPEVLASHGFSAWLAQELPDLKRPTAYRYADAFRALALPLTAKPAEIRDKIKTLRHQAGKQGLPMPSLAALYKIGKPAKRPDSTLILQKPADSQQLRLEDAREAFFLWREEFEQMVTKGQLDDLDKKGLLDLQEFTATVRDRIKARLK